MKESNSTNLLILPVNVDHIKGPPPPFALPLRMKGWRQVILSNA